MKKEILLCILITITNSSFGFPFGIRKPGSIGQGCFKFDTEIDALKYLIKNNVIVRDTDTIQFEKSDFKELNDIAFNNKKYSLSAVIFPENIFLTKKQWDAKAEEHTFISDTNQTEQSNISVEYILKRLLPHLKKTCGWTEGCPPSTKIVTSPSNTRIAQPLGQFLYTSHQLSSLHQWEREHDREKKILSKIILKAPTSIKPLSEQTTWKRLLLISSLGLCWYHRKPLWALGKVSLNFIKNHLGYS